MRLAEELIWQVWAKGYLTGNDPLLWRKDECGAWIFRGNYGKRNAEYGWEADHIKPVSEGGTDDISNLRPLHWENNIRKADGSLKCVVTAVGINNLRRE